MSPTMPTPSIKETISAHDEGEDLPPAQATCSDERPCLPCYLDQGRCLAALSAAPQSDGWVFYSADFSINALDATRPGRVMFRRDASGYAEWQALETPEAREGFELFRSGSGMTLDEAIANAFPTTQTQGQSHG